MEMEFTLASLEDVLFDFTNAIWGLYMADKRKAERACTSPSGEILKKWIMYQDWSSFWGTPQPKSLCLGLSTGKIGPGEFSWEEGTFDSPRVETRGHDIFAKVILNFGGFFIFHSIHGWVVRGREKDLFKICDFLNPKISPKETHQLLDWRDNLILGFRLYLVIYNPSLNGISVTTAGTYLGWCRFLKMRIWPMALFGISTMFEKGGTKIYRDDKVKMKKLWQNPIFARVAKIYGYSQDNFNGDFYFEDFSS